MKKALTFLGKDSGFGLKNTSAYAFVNDRLLLIDCGYTVFTEVQNRHLLYGVSGVDVIVTHLHADHAGSLSQLALFCYFKSIPFNVISDCKEIDNFLTITGVPRNKPVPGFASERYSRENNFVTFIPTEHCEELDCYGFSAEINGKHVVYTGDTKTLEPFISFLKEGTEFYIDASTTGDVHFNIRENMDLLDKLVAEKGVHIYLMHLDNDYSAKIAIYGHHGISICD